MNKKKFRSVVATASLLSSTLLLSVAPILSMPAASADGVVAINEWETTVNGDTTVLTNYIGQAKDVVIPLSGDLGTTNVKITKTALRAAATSADNQGGTLANSANDTAGTGLVADNSTDNNPSDTTVDYSGTFKDLTKITKIDLPQLKIEAHDGANGKSVTGADNADARGEDGQAGESIDVSSMFENCTALKEVDLSSFVGQSGQGGNGGTGNGGNSVSNAFDGRGGEGNGGNGGYAGNFNARNMFENTPTLIGIQLSSFVGEKGRGGNGGHGYGGHGFGLDYDHGSHGFGHGGNGNGGHGYHGGNGYGGYGGRGKPDDGEAYGGQGRGGNGYGGNGGDGNGGGAYDGVFSTGSNAGDGRGGYGGDGYGGTSYGGQGGEGNGADGGDGADGSYANGNGGRGGNGGHGYGGDGYGGKGGYGNGGNGGRGGNGAGDYVYNGRGGNGGNGRGGDGGYGFGHGGKGGDSGRGGNGGNVKGIDGESVDGQVDGFSLENALGNANVFKLYQAYTGITDKTNMFSPIAVNELALTKKVGFTLDELKENVGALRTTDSGKGENIRDSELGNVSLSAKDTAGNAIDLADVSKKAGEYTLTYTYNGKSIDTHLTVDGASIKTQDLTLGTGDAWKPEDNFVSAENEQQQPIPFDQLTVTGADQVNLSKAGTYTVSFSYQDVSQTLTADAKVNVIDIQTKSLVLGVGDPWQPYAALTSVTNVDQVEHTDQVYFEQNVTASAIDKGSGAAVDIAQLTANPGTYTVTYTYAGISRSVDVLVEKIELANQSVLPSDIDFGTPPIQYEKDQLLDGQTNGKPTEGKIEVKDTRSKTGEGYKVKVSQTQPFTGKNTKAELNATLSFKTGTLTNSENLPIAGSNQTIQLLPGQETIVLATTQGQSRGTTTLPLHTFQLVVPKEAEKRKDVYETILTWTLSDTP
ncbi:bacterial Ig-like domain-containing protein [Enterococcus faecalis]|uniref:bacterial Ig-like domain-containing protein n=1 Tax=Enterococcus faecalis TaxID=1351 RepID=UPI0025AF5C8E|nr:bacterial Ig-like domain-containing protein [Enterococcus faecalis]MDN3136335.1 bacterial Ig-like domain-containing protein [Enterococcus faecalis]